MKSTHTQTSVTQAHALVTFKSKPQLSVRQLSAGMHVCHLFSCANLLGGLNRVFNCRLCRLWSFFNFLRVISQDWACSEKYLKPATCSSLACNRQWETGSLTALERELLCSLIFRSWDCCQGPETQSACILVASTALRACSSTIFGCLACFWPS